MEIQELNHLLGQIYPAVIASEKNAELSDIIIKNAELVIGISDECCKFSKQLGAKKTIARISNTEYNNSKNNNPI